jgi:acetyl-CoA carboxylase biotin carboxyl carrier protein
MEMDGTVMHELRELVEFLKANEIAEFSMERPDLKMKIKFVSDAPTQAIDLGQLGHLVAQPHGGSIDASAATTSAPSAPSVAEAAPVAAAPAGHVVKSPIVGTFYDAPSPDAPTFVKIGDHVEVGQVLCIVEAMKLMNEIESDAAGEIVSRSVSTGQPVEYGQPLFTIKPL